MTPQHSPGMHAELPPTQVDADTRVVGLLAGRYRILRSAGRGGMGVVDVAHDQVLDCTVAIKQLFDPRLAASDVRHRLLHEGRALAALKHPGIARVQDVLESPPALVMEYVEGEPLSSWLDEPRTPDAVLDVLRQVVEAVAFAHRSGIVHCDLKPANIIVGDDGRTRLIDFGIARMVERAATTNISDHTNPVACTPRYGPRK